MAQPALNAVIPQAAVAGNLDLSIAATFGDGDVNGDLFIGNGSGEQEEESMDLICWIPNFGNQIPNLFFPIHACIDLAAKTLALKYISAYNYFMLTNAGMPWSNNFDLLLIKLTLYHFNLIFIYLILEYSYFLFQFI
jgi:hypothetical protein